jgi:integrase
MEAQELGVEISAIVEYYKRDNRPAETISIADATVKFIAAKIQSGKRERYTQQLGYSLKYLVEYIGPKTKCHDVSKSKIEDWIHSGKWSNRTKKGFLIDVATFFNFCLKNQWVGKSPCAGIEKISVEAVDICILTVDECKRLMATARVKYLELLPYVTLTLFCGIRPAEALRLGWENINLEHGHVIVSGEKSKTRQRRVVTIQPNALQWLMLCEGKPIKKPWRPFEALRKAAEVKWGHDIARHTFCSYSFPIFGAAKTASEAGHSETVLLKNYREIVRPADAKAFWEIVPD